LVVDITRSDAVAVPAAPAHERVAAEALRLIDAASGVPTGIPLGDGGLLAGVAGVAGVVAGAVTAVTAVTAAAAVVTARGAVAVVTLIDTAGLGVPLVTLSLSSRRCRQPPQLTSRREHRQRD